MSDAPAPAARLRAALLEVGLAIGGMFVGSSLFMVASALGLVPSGSVLRWLAGPVVTLVGVLAYRAVARWVDRHESPLLGPPPRKSAPFPRTSVGVAMGLAALGIGAAIGGSFILGLGLDALGAPVEEQTGIVELVEAFRSGGDPVPLIVLSVSAVALAPLAEELLFRGFVFRRIAARGGSMPEAYALSAAAFASIHLNPAGFVIYTWLGLVFADAYRRSGRLWVAMLVHAGNNAFALALLIWS